MYIYIFIFYYALGSELVPNSKNAWAGEVCLVEECPASRFRFWLAKRTNLCRPIHIEVVSSLRYFVAELLPCSMGLIPDQSP